jgi:hypothetical protein
MHSPTITAFSFDMTSLDPYLIKQLLQDVEAKNLPRREIAFLAICNEDIRRTFQVKFDYVKKWSIRKYVDYLEENGVPASGTTQRPLCLSPEPTTDDDALDNDNEAANDPTCTDEDRDDAVAMEDAFSSLSINDDELLEDDYCDLEKSGKGIFATPGRKTRTPHRSTIKKVRTPIRTPGNRFKSENQARR